ncbi:molybdopterin-dependent oxidoreductase [Thermodesulfobacteriota bacterium]
MTTRQSGLDRDVTIVSTTCAHDCGANWNCQLKLHVKDGQIIRIETDDGDEPQYRACARGRSQRMRVYAPDRVLYPMKRVGERGEAKFERISWDEALDTVAYKMKRIKEQHGPGAFVNLQYAGEQFLQGVTVGRLLNMFGGNLQHWGGASLEGNYWSAQATYGTRRAVWDWQKPYSAPLIIIWGWNPAETRAPFNRPLGLPKAKEAGSRIICVDPRYTNSAALFADQWIPIIPGTDAAMLIAMAYVIITENMQDQSFLDSYTVGFDRFKKYVLGMEDGVEKTPAWAQKITGVPAATIESLAREYASTKPAVLFPGFGPGRNACGEQFFRAAHTLMAMTGNIGATPSGAPEDNFIPELVGFGKGRNPFNYMPDEQQAGIKGDPNRYDTFDYSAPSRVGSSLDPVFKSRRRVLQSNIYDAILEGKAGGFPSDIKMVWVNCANTLNQLPNTNKGVKAFKTLDFILVTEQFMTPTAKYADILLPAKTHFERNSIYGGGPSMRPVMFYAKKAIEPMGESKSDFEICCELAPRLGIEDYSDKTEEEWLRYQINKPAMKKHIPNYDDFKAQGVYKLPPPEQVPTYESKMEDLKNNPFPTPSGKIEIYSEEVASLNNPKLPPIPKYMETWEGRNDPLAEKYPLQLITSHHRLRAHSVFDNVSWLKKLEPQRVWINRADAEARGIRDWEEVRIFNDRGEIIIPAFVTETIMPGVVNICEGAWFNPDSDGVDRGGCPNVLTRDESSPAGAWSTHTSLVEVAKRSDS